MGGKHKKLLRSEKSKVKLKGAKLPKGLNVTKTDFKIKKIVIKEQIAEVPIEGGREPSIKEILSRLKHHNASFRMTAIKSLKSAIISHELLVLRHLGQIIQGVAAICLDIESDVRRESFKVMSSLLALTTAEEIVPFFEMMASYLRCAMTHIQPNIQDDALLFLDVLIKYVPDLIAESGDAIFTNFLDMISKQKHDNRQGRALSTNISKVKTTKWRNKVLQCLSRMFFTVLEHKKSTLVKTSEGSSSDILRYCTAEEKYFPLIRRYQDIGGVDVFKSLSNNSSESKDEGDQLTYYITVLIPLLFESWMEVNPSSSHEQKLPLNEDGAYTLKTVLELLETIWELVELWEMKVKHNNISTFFRREYSSNFAIHFCTGFPYEQLNIAETKKKTKNSFRMEVNDKYCLQQNLLLCHLFCKFCSTEIDKYSKVAHKIQEFLTTSIQGRGLYKNIIIAPNLEKILRSILYTHGRDFLNSDGEEQRALLKEVLKLQMFQHRGDLLDLICCIILDDFIYNSYGQLVFTEWLSTLPRLLCQPVIQKRTIITLCNLGKRKSTIFLKALAGNALDVLDNLTSAKFNGFNNFEDCKRSVIDLFYWIDDWSTTDFEKLQEYLRKNSELAQYFPQITDF